MQAYEQKSVALPLGGVTVVITEMTATDAIRFGAILGSAASGAMVGVSSIKRTAGGAMGIHIGETMRGALDRLLEKPEAVRDLVKCSVSPEVWAGDAWFDNTFRARHLPDLFLLVQEILTLNYGPTLELLKKKIGQFIELSFSEPGNPAEKS